MVQTVVPVSIMVTECSNGAGQLSLCPCEYYVLNVPVVQTVVRVSSIYILNVNTVCWSKVVRNEMVVFEGNTSYMVRGADNYSLNIDATPGIQHKVVVQALTATGKLGPPSPPVFGVPQENKEEDNRPIWIITAVASVVVFACVIFIICKVKLCYSNRRAKLDLMRDVKPRPNRRRKREPSPSSPSRQPLDPQTSANTGETFLSLESGVNGLNRAAGATAENAAWHPQSVASVVLDVDCSIDNGNIPQYPEHSNSRDRQQEDNMDIGAEGLAESRSPRVEAARNPGYLPRFWLPDELKEWQNAPPGVTEEGCNKKDNPVPLQPVKPAAGNDTKYEGKELCVDEQAIPCTVTSPSVMSGNVQEPSAYVRQVPSEGKELCVDEQAIPCTATSPSVMSGNVQEPSAYVRQVPSPYVRHQEAVDPYLMVGNGGVVGRDATGTVGHDVTGTVGHDVTGTVGHDVTGTVGRDVTGTVGHGVTDTVGHNVTGTVGHSVTGAVGAYDFIGTVGHYVTGTVGHDVTGTVGHDVTSTMGHDVTGTVGRDVTGTVGHGVTDTVGHNVTGTVGHSVTGAVGAYVTVGYPNADDGHPVGSYVRCENWGGEHHANSDEGSREPSAAAAHGRNSPSFLGVSRPDNRGSQDGQGETGLSDYLQISK
ncbi:hypothetical protein BaRGS_00023502 [Batillaria attramentaria]|uniref:Gp5/Type VI secretion system Vgr C-terminal trimerisation domain-containing protein n=1 Tax=Batillaria attramentaria TaxID=370345 RepID=A0ABD0KDS0_9CAEN